MKNTKKAREVAAMKFEALAPLLSTEQDPAKAKVNNPDRFEPPFRRARATRPMF